MQPWRGSRRAGDELLESGLPLFELVELRLQPRRAQPVCDRLDETVELAPDIVELAPLQDQGQLRIAPLPIHFGMELPGELGNEIGLHQVVLESVEDDALQHAATDSLAVGAGAESARGAA